MLGVRAPETCTPLSGLCCGMTDGQSLGIKDRYKSEQNLFPWERAEPNCLAVFSDLQKQFQITTKSSEITKPYYQELLVKEKIPPMGYYL